MKIVVTGVNGQLGFDVLRELSSRGFNNVEGIDIKELDITDSVAVSKFMDISKPDVIIHCAAYTAVDKAEDNQDICHKVNVDGTRNLVNAAKKNNAKFVYISTDYVFDGTKNSPYLINDDVNPQSVYGLTKFLGEEETRKYPNHFIIRISWVFGKNGFNFIKTMLKLAFTKKSLNIVSDQVGSPTYTLDLSRLIVDMISTDKFGTYQATNEGTCNWYEFANEIFKLVNQEIKTVPITTDQYPTRAKRPFNSRMDKSSLDISGFKRLPSWQDALKRYLKEIEVIK